MDRKTKKKTQNKQAEQSKSSTNIEEEILDVQKPHRLEDGTIVYKCKGVKSRQLYFLYLLVYGISLLALLVLTMTIPWFNWLIAVIVFLVITVLLELLIGYKIKHFTFEALILGKSNLHYVTRPLAIFKRRQTFPWVDIESISFSKGPKLKLKFKNGNHKNLNLENIVIPDYEKLAENLEKRL